LKYRGAPRGLRTPPYVTAEPVVTHRKLSFLPVSDSGSAPASSPKSTLRFVVIATDGLWDALSSEEVVSLVGGYLEGKRGAVPKSALAKSVMTTETARTVEGKVKDQAAVEPKGSWAFADQNVGTHLIRNAFGGADEEQLQKLVSIPAPTARRFRDDVTVTVVWWEDGGPLNTKPEVTAKL
jgi:pyruvate dehydrogenase phosphatase